MSLSWEFRQIILMGLELLLFYYYENFPRQICQCLLNVRGADFSNILTQCDKVQRQRSGEFLPIAYDRKKDRSFQYIT